jgi:hypothetical protein
MKPYKKRRRPSPAALAEGTRKYEQSLTLACQALQEHTEAGVIVRFNSTDKPWLARAEEFLDSTSEVAELLHEDPQALSLFFLGLSIDGADQAIRAGCDVDRAGYLLESTDQLVADTFIDMRLKHLTLRGRARRVRILELLRNSDFSFEAHDNA